MAPHSVTAVAVAAPLTAADESGWLIVRSSNAHKPVAQALNIVAGKAAVSDEPFSAPFSPLDSPPPLWL